MDSVDLIIKSSTEFYNDLKIDENVIVMFQNGMVFRVEMLYEAPTVSNTVKGEVTAVNMNLVTGSREDGYLLSVHNPKSSFDDSVLWEGSAAYTYVAMRWLADHRE